LGHEFLEVLDGAKLREDLTVVGNVVAAVIQGRTIERRKPESINAQPFEIVQLANEAWDVAHPVAIGVIKGPNHHLIEDGPPVPLGVVFEPSMGIGEPKIHEPNSLRYRENSSARELL
jgi:hypothetical protein